LQGIYEFAHVSLGAVRLEIIDLLSGDQPLHSEDNDSILNPCRSAFRGDR
jgi:asparagine synthetase B (glutamine-hydrolysing)